MARLDMAAAAPDEWPLACRLALGPSREDELESRVERLLAVIRRGDFDPSGLLLARRAGVPIGAIAAQVLPGGTGVLMPPFASDPETRDALVGAAIDHFRRFDVAIAHCALSEDDAPLAAPLLGAGFQLVTRLVYMLHRSSILPAFARGPRSGLKFIAYSDGLQEAFGDTLLRTYSGSLDLPEATVDRPVAQLLAGYRHGQSDPLRWWLVEGPTGEAVGVVILNGLHASEAMEIGYLGLVPEHRRKGYGHALIEHVLAIAERAGIEHVGLSVDARNVPAINLYAGSLFRVYGSQQLYLMRMAPLG